MISFAQELFRTLSAGQDKQKASLIIDTSQLLHSQVQMLLDRSLMENNRFAPQLTQERLLLVIREAVEILRGQASLKKLELQFEPELNEVWLMLD